MIRAAVLITLTLAPTLAPVPATAQVGCLPPEEPFAYEPPKDDPELRALIDEQYQDYITGSESYLNCLNDEAVRARAAYDEVFERYIRYFGVEAGVEFDATD